MAKAVQARDKLAHRSHHVPDTRKHDVFEGPGPETLKHVFWSGLDWNSAAGAGRSGAKGKQRFGM